MTRIRRLAALDQANHGAAVSVSEPAASEPVASSAYDDVSDPSVLLGLDMSAEPANTEAAPAEAVIEPEGVEEPTTVEVPLAAADVAPARPAPAGESAEAILAPVRLEPDARPELLDTLGSLGPIFRAAAVFPGPDAKQEDTLQVIRMLSRDAVMLADIVARDTDQLEIDQRWRRRRAGLLTSEMVASHWLSTVIGQGGLASIEEWPSANRPRLAAALAAAIDQVSETPLCDASTATASSAVFALAPLVLDLQRFADVVHISVPSFLVDADTAAALIGAVVGEEVHAGVLRLEPLLPGMSKLDIGSELMAQVGPMALAAWEGARGELLDRLKDIDTEEDAHKLLSDPNMNAGIPVERVCERLRPMVRRLVGSTVYSAKMIGGAQ
ncbi:hypothetical protein LMG667_03295 [Xanthomonas euvesicatoria]|nr:hypothetical protein LMG667_03295 [Xanthomonas euvesicatoria]